MKNLKNYTLEGLTNFDNKEWYGNFLSQFNTDCKINYPEKARTDYESLTTITFKNMTEALKDYYTINHTEITYDTLLVDEKKDNYYCRYYIQHYNSNYYTLVTCNFDKILYNWLTKNYIEELLKNQAWEVYTDIMVNEKIIHNYDNFALRTEYEKVRNEFINGADYDLWEENLGVFDEKFENFEPEIKALQDEINKCYEEALKADEEILKVRCTFQDNLHEDGWQIDLEMSKKDFRSWIIKFKNNVENNKCMILGKNFVNLKWFEWIILFDKNENGLYVEVDINNYIDGEL